MFVNCFNLVDICHILDLVQLDIFQATTLFTDCKSKFKSSQAFKIFQHTKVDLGTENSSILEFLKVLNMNLKSPIIKSLYIYINQLIESNISKQNEINELREEIRNIRGQNRRPEDRVVITSYKPDVKAKKDLYLDTLKNLAEQRSKESPNSTVSADFLRKAEKILNGLNTLPGKEIPIESQEEDIPTLRNEFAALKSLEETKINTNSQKNEISGPKQTEEHIKYLKENSKDKKDFNLILSALQEFANSGDLDTIKWACANGYADIVDDLGRDIFTAAAAECSLDLLKALVSCNVDTKHLDKSRLGPLHWSIQKNRFDIAEYLVVNKLVDVNVKDTSDLTPLHYACAKNCLPLIKALVNSDGIKINQSNQSGKTPLDYVGRDDQADKSKTEEVKSFLASKGAI